MLVTKIDRNEDELIYNKNKDIKITTAQDVKDKIKQLNDSDDRKKKYVH